MLAFQNSADPRG